jgi:hypothetical protein
MQKADASGTPIQWLISLGATPKAAVPFYLSLYDVHAAKSADIAVNAEMNERLKLGISKGRANGRVWVLADADRSSVFPRRWSQLA